MSERKVLNKYYPPDFDPSKIPRMKLAKNRQYTVRLMAPFNMRCKTCGEYIYKGKKFNARKEDVENETYLGIRIYRFYIKCTRCLQEISFKTDPQNTDYEIEAGATRNFMALKLAEEQAKREEDEIREEEQNNPMKLLENRTKQSRNEIEMLESLEELRDLNKRQQAIDYESMLQQYNNAETERERLERQEREDEEFIKNVKFKNQPKIAGKIIAEEIIEVVKEEKNQKEIKNMNEINTPTATKLMKTNKGHSVGNSNIKVNPLSNLVKRKQPLVIVKTKKSTTETNATENEGNVKDKIEITTQNATIATNAASKTNANSLSLLAAYSDSSENDEDET